MVGGFGVLSVWDLRLDRMLYVLAGGVAAWGLLLLISAALRGGMLKTLVADIDHMPRRMRELVPVQFFSWLALFAMWTQTTAAVTRVHFGAIDATGAAYNEGANWVGVLFAAYNGFAALAAVVIPWLVRAVGMRVTHLINLWLGGCALLSFLVIRDPQWLLLSMVGRRLRVGVDPLFAVRNAGRQRALAQDGRVQGHPSLLHRDPAAGDRQRARPAAATASLAVSLSTHWPSAARASCWRGVLALRVK
jgi:hypothetical protein